MGDDARREPVITDAEFEVVEPPPVLPRRSWWVRPVWFLHWTRKDGGHEFLFWRGWQVALILVFGAAVLYGILFGGHPINWGRLD